MRNTSKSYLRLQKQLLAPKGNKTEHEKKLRCKLSGLKKTLCRMEVKLAKMQRKLNKETKCASTQTGNEQKVDEVNIQTLRQEVKPPPVAGAAVTTTPSQIMAKRPGSSMSPTTTIKRPRLDTSSPDPASFTPLATSKPMNIMDVTGQQRECHTVKSLISRALNTLQESCFDALPTIAGRLLFGRVSEVPGLTDKEKSVISDFCENQALAQELMTAILCMIEAKGAAMNHKLLQTLCRVYVGMCQKTGDYHKAHALAYRLLKEDFPEAPKLILVMATAWPSVFSNDSSLCRAIQKVTKLKAVGDVIDYLSDYLHWLEKPPGYVHQIISSTLKALFQDSSLTFRKNSWYGVDLCPAAWDYIYSLDLLCTQQGFIWTFIYVIRQEIWQTMSTWLMRKISQQSAIGDVCVAALLRLLGRLGQLGLKEKEIMTVQDLTNGIKDFANYTGGYADMPWEVQLSVFYATHDLAPGNPRDALEALTSWQKGMKQAVPPAVTSCIKQITTFCNL
ncbi:little elongation complex subunit 1-like [Tachysurus fulvidraco]|uniref:little elongation complex subunit 1-like n=1 Tax=Tachysurus fulvidraco TaxID=1234273 RepID=UPI001FF07486|nr:little elongation complex subunit 1-like [Tachysurus fulvidraco]XP_047669906.1 little elongation complex subunit 1-like [Tachysurus fulvidraco]